MNLDNNTGCRSRLFYITTIFVVTFSISVAYVFQAPIARAEVIKDYGNGHTVELNPDDSRIEGRYKCLDVFEGRFRTTYELWDGVKEFNTKEAAIEECLRNAAKYN